jgi:hypothetical protein
LQNGKVDSKESVREDVMQSYFNSVQQKTPDTKQLIPMSNNKTLREKPRSHMSLINLSEGPVKRYGGSESKNAEIRKKQLNKTYDIIINKEANESVEDDWRLIRKQNFEYPDYQAKVSDEENARIREFNFKSKQNKVELIESPTKKSDLQNFLRSFGTDKEEIKEVLEVMKELLDVRIDNRMLHTLRETLISNNKTSNSHVATVEDFRTAWRTLMSRE